MRSDGQTRPRSLGLVEMQGESVLADDADDTPFRPLLCFDLNVDADPIEEAWSTRARGVRRSEAALSRDHADAGHGSWFLYRRRGWSLSCQEPRAGLLVY